MRSKHAGGARVYEATVLYRDTGIVQETVEAACYVV